MEQPLIPLLCAFAAGITAGHYCRVADLPLMISLLLVLILLLAASIKKSAKLIAILVILSSALFGILNVNQYLHLEPSVNHIINYVARERLIIEGVICESPEASPDRTELTLSANRLIGENAATRVEGLILLNVEARREFKYGDAIRFTTRLKVPHNYQNPGGFDYAKYLRYKGVMVRGFIKDGDAHYRCAQGHQEPGYVCPSSRGIHLEHAAFSKQGATRNCGDKLRQRQRIQRSSPGRPQEILPAGNKGIENRRKRRHQYNNRRN
jgi:hypothetical protein